jgi:pSer/pThr/pTyr-binding forkhead associated (FHA) protein/tetratricopeptide (TPR) repeat protein
LSIAVLTVLRDGQPVATQPVEGEVVLGRAEGCVIRLDDRAISRHHAVFRPVSGGVQVERKSEFAPLSVNGSECTRAVLKEGDVISIGPYLLKLSEQRAQQQARASAAAGSPEGGGLESLESPPPLVGGEVTLPIAEIPTSMETAQGPMTPILGNSEVLNLADVSSEPPPEEAAAPASEAADFDLNLAVSGGEPISGATDSGPIVAEVPEISGDLLEIVDDDAKTRISSPDKVKGKLTFQAEAANVTELEIGDDPITIGRGKECEVVLNTKKASRKHAMIRRVGARFVIQDLESANGTFVNGRKIREADLSGDDAIRIGNIEFSFRALSQDYLKNEHQFMPVEALESPAPSAEPGPDPALEGLRNPMSLAGATQAVDLAQPRPQIQSLTGTTSPGMANIAGIRGAQKPKSLIEKFRALPPKRQVIWAIIVAALFYFLVIEDDTAQKAPPAKKPQTAQIAKDGKVAASFERLTDDQKRFVISQHDLAFENYKNKDYDKAIYEIEKIFTLIPDYKDSREIERYAKEGKRKLEALEEERRKKEEEARLKAQVAQLVDQADSHMKKKEYAKARDLFYQILAIEPDNARVSGWKKEIASWEEEQERLKTQHEVQAEINKRAWEQYKEALAIQKKGRYHTAIAEFGKVKDIGASDKRVLSKALAHIRSCRKAIRDALEPVLAEARQLEQSSDFHKAYEAYKRATKIEPHDKEGWKGMQRIHKILRDRARILYAEGVMAESYSDFETAKKKFQETMEVAPEDGLYHDRAQRKLSTYLRREPAASMSSGGDPTGGEPPGDGEMGGGTP